MLAAGGCAGPLSVLDPAGPHAASVATLWWVMLAGAVLLAGLVFALLALAMVRRHSKAAVVERRWIIGLGLVMPSAVLLALLGYALFLGGRILPTPAPDTVTIGVEARRYAWAFRHPGGQVTQGVLHIPAGRPVDLVITATDVIHSFWVPRLAGKMDAIPGHTNRLRIVAARPGTYRGECAEYCGTGHREHGFTVIAHDAAGWAALRQGQ
ncbi:cytochrome c oxidase subunit II [Sphingomonas sp. T9W2]|uniref:cytochrome c oxidase subunit II n=1 Tax=Sphingomonas sp. T9W2 TaxID=3143183 RepID=UPI0031F4C39A